MNSLNIVTMLKVLPGVILGLTVHEYAHAYAAYKLGDHTAKDMGRLTFNPLRHIDPLGFIFILVAGFGWAKPVMFNPEYLKNKHRDEILISLAGPLANLMLGFFLFLMARIFAGVDVIAATTFGKATIQFLLLSGVLNFGLFIFNLIPLPPLDGSHIYLTFLKTRNELLFNAIYKYGTLILLGIVIFESQSNITILPIHKIIELITNLMIDLLRFNQ